MRKIFFEGLAVASGLLTACAYVPPRADLSQMSQAYRRVASGQTAAAQADRIAFARDENGVLVRRTWTEPYDDWSSKMDDDMVANDVHHVLKEDPALRGQAITAIVDKGVAELRGQVPSDELAMRAARDVVGVAGVIAVRMDLVSPPDSR